MNTKLFCRLSANEHDIILEVARHYSIQPETMKLRTRKRVICEARQVAMCLIKHSTNLSNNQVGKMFGGFDHSTVSHSKKLINTLYTSDKEIKGKVDGIVEGIKK